MASPEEKATEVAIAFWNRLCEHAASSAADERLFYRLTATLGEFAGTIERARLDLSCRTPPGFDFAAFDAFLATIAGDAQLTVDERTPAAVMERSAPTVRALAASIRQRGVQPKYKVKTGTSDMNIVNTRWPVPMAAYGPGDSSLDHTADEHLDLQEFTAAVEVLRDALPPLLAELNAQRAENVYSDEEEADLAARLEALGYLE
jgi:LysW-gamma-L-lysine carboxypeptidase